MRATSNPQPTGGGCDHQPKRFAGRANQSALRLPAPTRREVREARLRVSCSQGRACDLAYIREVATWSKYESGVDSDLSSIPPLVWETFLLKTGQHPLMMVLPRMGIPMPKMEAAHRRRPGDLPADKVRFVVEHRRMPARPADPPEPWQPLPGQRFTVMTGACVAMDALLAALKLGALRVARYVDGQFDSVTANPADDCLEGGGKGHA